MAAEFGARLLGPGSVGVGLGLITTAAIDVGRRGTSHASATALWDDATRFPLPGWYRLNYRPFSVNMFIVTQ